MRTSEHRPCPVCGGIKWCGYTDDGAFAVCMRVCDGAVKSSANGGWVHILRQQQPTAHRRRRRVIQNQESPNIDWNHIVGSGVERTNSAVLQRFSDQLGVSADSLRRLQVFYYKDHNAWGFPMRDAQKHIIGVRLRARGGKFAIQGTRNGLFVPFDLPADGQVVIAEGESDTAALLSLGLAAIGVPGARQCSDMAALLARGRPVVIIGDNDAAGTQGVKQLCDYTLLRCPDVRTVHPPKDVKDAREWVQEGLSSDDLQELIRRSPPHRLIASRS